jgi:hypothetical protein
VQHERMVPVGLAKVFGSHPYGASMGAVNGGRARVIQRQRTWAHRVARLEVPTLATCRFTNVLQLPKPGCAGSYKSCTSKSVFRWCRMRVLGSCAYSEVVPWAQLLSSCELTGTSECNCDAGESVKSRICRVNVEVIKRDIASPASCPLP